MGVNPSGLQFVMVVWTIVQVAFPFIVLGLLIAIHLRLKDMQRLQSEVFREVTKQGRSAKAGSPDRAAAQPPTN